MKTPFKIIQRSFAILSVLYGIGAFSGKAEAQPSRLYKEREMMVMSEGWRLYGTLVQPTQSKEPASVVLLIAGSGPTDRQGNSGATVAPAYLKKLAEALAAHGIASLRYDKRGVGASQDKSLQEERLLFTHYVQDAVAWIHRLRQMGRFRRIVVLGHSEGALVATLACQKEKPDALILLCGAGFPSDSLLKQQLTANPFNRPWLSRAFSLIDSIRAGQRPGNIPAALQSLFRPSVQPYLASWFEYDPAAELARLELPKLVIGGSTDIQVNKNNFERLCTKGQASDCFLIDGMNHVLVEASDDYGANLATYFDPQRPLHRLLVEKVLNFMHQLQP